jgi:hypothetical protein
LEEAEEAEEAEAEAAEAEGLARLKLMVEALLRRAALSERERWLRGVQSG